MARLHRDELTALCRDAVRRAGADLRAAQVLVVTVEAEPAGNRAVGVAHLFGHLDGYLKGRIAVDVRPAVRRTAPGAATGRDRPGLLVHRLRHHPAGGRRRRTPTRGMGAGPDGEPTRDAAAALAGTLLPFGGYRGGNVALLVEVLATLSGAAFSVDAAPFDRGGTSPGIGVHRLRGAGD